METKKFPVTSERTGQEYQVSIKDVDGIFSGTYVRVDVYVKRKFFRWEYFSQINSTADNWYRAEGWDFDFINMAVNEISKFEAEIMTDLLNEKRKEEGLAAFEKWDGRIIEGGRGE